MSASFLSRLQQLGATPAALAAVKGLLQVSNTIGAELTDGAVLFAFPMTQSDLADATGLSVVHVNRSLQTLRRDVGLVFERRQLTIPRWTDLVRIAEFDSDYLSVAPLLDLDSRCSLQAPATRST